MSWKLAGIGVEGKPLLIGSLNVWDYEWRPLAEQPVQLPHPSHPQELHRMDHYFIEEGQNKIRFAAGELSANVWAFYVPA